MTPLAPPVTPVAPPAMLGAASPLTWDLVSGPERSGTVLARFPTAVYLQVGRHHEVLPVVASDALMLPTAVRLPVPSADLLWRLEPSDRVSIGHLTLHLRCWSVHLVRQWRPGRVTPVEDRARNDRLAHAACWMAAAGVDGGLADRAGDLLAAALAGDATATRAHVGRLVGAGSGLTPSGDDALCAVLLVLHALGSDVALRTASPQVAAAWTATTSLSASLLEAATHGYAVPQVAALVRAGVAGDEPAAASALEAVLAIGHSSGRDLVAGLVGCLRTLARMSRAVPPPSASQPAERDNP